MARGAAHYCINSLDAALNDFSEALEKDPDSVDAYFGRSLTHTNLGDADLAFADANKVISLNPEVAEAYCVRGSVFLRMRVDPMAQNDFEKCFQLNNDLRTYWEKEIDRLKRQRSSTNKIEWLSSFNEAYNLAFERQLFLIVWFNQEGPFNKKFEDNVAYSPYIASLVPCAIFVKLDISNPQSRTLFDKLGLVDTPTLVLMPPIAEKIESFFNLEGYFEPYVAADSLNKTMLLSARLGRAGTPQKFIDNPESVCQ